MVPGRFPAAWPLGQQREEQGDLLIFSLALFAIFLVEEGTRSSSVPVAGPPVRGPPGLNLSLRRRQVEFGQIVFFLFEKRNFQMEQVHFWRFALAAL